MMITKSWPTMPLKPKGVHTRRSHNEATWKKVETDWLNSGDQPPRVTSRRIGAASRN